MRPLKLTIEAFGSYAEMVEIDFVKLGQHGVFSITGPTGSGKTTIFDAMVYALYGVLPGKRLPGDVRSHFADPTCATNVTFEFEVRGAAWSICRIPTQSRPKEKGTGETVKQGSIVLKQLSGGSVTETRVKQANARIIEIIGLTSSQFQQVVLLPQGEFEAVLKADTSERADLLRKLFPVEIYRDLTEVLSQRVAATRAAYDEARRGSATATDQIRKSLLEALNLIPDGLASTWYASMFDAETFDLSTIAARQAELFEVVEAVGGLVTVAEGQRDATAEAFSKVETSVKDFDAWVKNKELAESFPEAEELDTARELQLSLLQELVGLIPLLDAHGGLESDLEETTAAELAANAELERVWDDRYGEFSEIDEVSLKKVQKSALAEIQALKNAATERDELLELGRVIQDLEVEFREASEDEAAQVAAQSEAKTNLKELDAFLKSTRAELKSKDKKRDAFTAAKQLEVEVIERNTLETQLTTQTKKLEGERTRVEKLELELTALEAKYRAGLSGELARSLVDGAPCPTCGSCEHPDPAAQKKSSPSLEQLDEAKKKLTDASIAFGALEEGLAGQKAAREKITTTLTLEEAQEAREACELEVDRLDALAEEVTTAEEEREALEVESSNAATQLETARSARTRIEAELKVEKKALETRTKAFMKAHGPLADFLFDGEAFNEFLEAVDEFLTTSAARSSATGAVTQSQNLFKEHLVVHGAETAKELRAQLLESDDIAGERSVLSNRKTERAQVRKDIADFEALGPSPVRPGLEEVRTASEEAKDRFTAILSTSTLLKNCGDQITQELEAIAGNEDLIARTLKEYQDTNSLFRMCAGQTSGSNDMKVSLEDWVLSYYFKQVLAQANIRLNKMTGGRYSLQVNSTGGDARSRHGLDVEVDDMHTGRARSARTLSGGETFMSALALALGLADVVAGRNHELQALFIDEGFGSLDEKSLDQVLTILEGLQDGGRVVGVISHVEELKRILPQGIEVEGTESGSRVTLHYPGE